MKGRRHSPETIAKMSAAAKSRVRSPHSPETRAKISIATRGKRKSAEHRAKIAASNRASSRTAEHLAKLAAARRGTTLSPEARAKARMKAAEGKSGEMWRRHFVGAAADERSILVGRRGGTKEPLGWRGGVCFPQLVYVGGDAVK
jgi:hypothetical protein